MTADTSAVVAALSSWHEQHEVAARALHDVTSLPAHVMLESFSVLTSLPSGLAVPAPMAAEVLEARFPDRPLQLGARERRRVLQTLAGAGVMAGAAYDGLVALEARAHGRLLLTLDRRAQQTYRRMGVEHQLI